MASRLLNSNPLLADWKLSQPFGIPPFHLIKPQHFKTAFSVAMKIHLNEVASIVESNKNSLPTFDSTIACLDRAGGLLTSINNCFSNLCSSCTSPQLQAVELEMAPILANHDNKIYTFPGLFDLISVLYETRFDTNLNYNAIQIRLLERFYLDFVRMGAKFDESSQKRYGEIMEQLASLQTIFSQNVLADESEICIYLSKDEMDGCPDDLLAAAKQAAHERKIDKPDIVTSDENEFMITLSRSFIVPFLTFCNNRSLREKAFNKWTQRGELNSSRDNKEIALKILKLRIEQAKLHGFSNFAEYQSADSMAKSPNNIMELLERVWTPAKVSAERERKYLQEYMDRELQTSNGHSEGSNGKKSVASLDGSKAELKGWDWRYYAEKVRIEKYDFDESLLKPYLSLHGMQTALFDCGSKLYNLVFLERKDIKSYHPDVQTFEVFEKSTVDGEKDKLLAVFMHDNYARSNKRSGAWMSELRSQSRNGNNYVFPSVTLEENGQCSTNDNDAASANFEATEAEIDSFAASVVITPTSEHVIPLVLNNNNFAKGSSEGDVEGPTLLSFDDVITLFHEFGHGLHGMLSNVEYARLASTNVLRDFVELPSQLMEHWIRSTPLVLKAHAKHYQTKEIISEEMLNKLTRARNFNQGFATIEYTACALLDQLLHTLDNVDSVSLEQYEKQELKRLEMPDAIVMRHRLPHFQHLFSSSSYASAYYVYLWAEVLDADAFDAFLESGNIFDPATAARVKKHVYSAGNSADPSELFRLFRGRDPKIEPMLKKKGLVLEG